MSLCVFRATMCSPGYPEPCHSLYSLDDLTLVLPTWLKNSLEFLIYIFLLFPHSYCIISGGMGNSIAAHVLCTVNLNMPMESRRREDVVLPNCELVSCSGEWLITGSTSSRKQQLARQYLDLTYKDLGNGEGIQTL